MLYLTLWGCKFVGNENHKIWSPTNNDDFTVMTSYANKCYIFTIFYRASNLLLHNVTKTHSLL